VRWYRSLTPAQQRILLAMALALVAVVGLLGWSVWSTLQAGQGLSPLTTPGIDDSVLPTPTPSLTPTATPSPTPTPTPQFDVSRAGIVAGQVADARNSTTRWGTPLTVVDNTGMAQAVYAHNKAWGPAAMPERSVLEALKLWDESPLRLDAVGQAEVTAALYAPEVEELYLRRDWYGSLEMLETQLAYGYARSLPDQYGDLVTRVEEAPSLDRRLTLTAVAEGDAFVSTLLYLGITPGETGTDDVYDAVSQAICPEWQTEDALLEDLSCLSFRLGTEFAVAQYRDGGTEALDEAILRPPRSTEQLLNPIAYADSEEPTVLVPLDAGLGRGWELTTTQTLGQVLTHKVLAEWTNELVEGDGAAGWAGDLLQVWHGSDDSALAAWQLDWDSLDRAVSFYFVLRDMLPNPLVRGLITDTTPEPSLPGGRWWSGGQGAVFLVRRARTVWLIWSDDAAAVESAAAGIP